MIKSQPHQGMHIAFSLNDFLTLFGVIVATRVQYYDRKKKWEGKVFHIVFTKNRSLYRIRLSSNFNIYKKFNMPDNTID